MTKEKIWKKSWETAMLISKDIDYIKQSFYIEPAAKKIQDAILLILREQHEATIKNISNTK